MRTAVVCLVATAMCVGCGGGSEGRVNVYPVIGKVTQSGQPVGGATVMFSSADGKTPMARGKSKDDGTYTLTTYDYGDGAALGDYIVMISKTAAPDTNEEEQHDPTGMSDPAGEASHGGSDSNGEEESQSLLNEKYMGNGSPLKETVKEGDNSFDFDLDP